MTRVEEPPAPIVARRAVPLPRPDRVRLGRGLLVADALAAGTGLALLGPRWSDVLAVALALVGLGAQHLYRSRLTLSVLDDLPALALAVVGALAGAGAVANLFEEQGPGSAGAVAVLLLLPGRAAGYAAVRVARSRGVVAHRTLIVGAGAVGSRLAQVLIDHPENGLRPVAFVDELPPPSGATAPSLPLSSSPSDLADTIRELEIRVVIVAFGLASEPDLVGLLRTCDQLACTTFVVPRLYELGARGRDVESLRGVPLTRLRPSALRPGALRSKRAFDVVVAAGALVLLSPLLAVLALGTRLDGGPGVIFRQVRVGRDGRTFELLKFRSLAPRDPGESEQRWNVSGDPQMSWWGRVLRRTSLDELPQLWNVLNGSMSLVGPRPERPYFVEQFTSSLPHYPARHRLPAGLTGWAQVNGLRGDTSISERAVLDNAYIESWSLWMDCKVLARTAGQVVRGAGS